MAVVAKILGILIILLLFMVTFIFLWNKILRPLIFSEKLDEMAIEAGEEYTERKVKESINDLLSEEDNEKTSSET